MTRGESRRTNRWSSDMSTERTITITDIGPLKKPVVITAKPGIGVLTGYCGTGKTLCLQAIGVALGNKDRGAVAPTNGKKKGTVDVLGVVLNVTPGRITRSGETEVVSLEEFTLADLINPPVKEEEAKNRYGIKSLLRISGKQADPALFHHLLGDKKAFEAIIPPDAVKSADLVEMAGKVKRAIEAEKRKALAEAEREEGAAAADRNAMEGVTKEEAARYSTETPESLQAIHTRAVQEHAKLKTEWDAFFDAQEEADEARKKLEAATGGKKTIAECETEEACRKIDYDKAAARVKELEDELRIAKSEKMSAFDIWESAKSVTQSARDSAQATEGWQAAINAIQGKEQPDQDKLLAAEEAVTQAQNDIQRAAVVRAALARKANAEKHQKAADEARKLAHKFDLAAKGTDSILSEAVASPRYSVDGTFLMGKVRDGETKPYYELSAGEKTMIAVEEKIDRVCAERDRVKPGELAMVDLDQTNFQEIPDSVRDRLDAYAREKNCFLSTGMVTDDKEIGFYMWAERNGKAK